MQKWMRNYRAEFIIGHWDKSFNMIDEEVLEIKYPFTCNFMTDLGTYSSANRAVFQFYNLSAQDQAKLWKDIFEVNKYIKMSFHAGYGDTMPLIFQGIVNQCLSSRPSGSVDWVTEMQVFNQSSFKKYGYINATFNKDTKFKDVINAALEKNPDIKLGYISPDIPSLPRNTTFIGQTLDILGRNYGEYEIFVNENLELNIIGENDVLPGQIQVITDSTGLLGSPRRANAFVELDTVFEPQIRVGQAISLLSNSQPRFNQAYKVCDVRHQGVISPVVCDKLITTIALSRFSDKPRVLQKDTPPLYEGTQTSGMWIKPCKGQRISRSFGSQIHPIYKIEKNHEGIDIAANANEPVVAPANGIVINAYYYGGYGNYIQINHGKNESGQILTSAYGHLNSYIVGSGQKVQQGEVIGYVGSTGQDSKGQPTSTGPHLHFEIRLDGKPTNPVPYIGTY